MNYDIIVIGGGIHGAGVAQAAAAAGYKTLVVEQRALAAGTSSRSSKLIHGGLRYLETGQFKLVRECLRERQLLLRNAPRLVRLVPFHIPVYAETRRRPWQLRIGLSLYAVLAGLRRSAGFRSLPRADWPSLDGLRQQGLQAVLQYWDAQTDDRRLTEAVMASARSLGAELVMPAEMLDARWVDGTWRVTCRRGDQARTCCSQVLINAAGPWAGQVLKRITPASEPLPVDLVQGAHIVLEGGLRQGVYYLEAPGDGRAVFAMPWQGRVMVGTTETPFTGDPAAVAPKPEEIDYLLRTLGHYFPAYQQHRREDVEAFAGLRVLPAGKDAAFTRSRETVLHPASDPRPRLLTIYGGKLTAYRATAEAVMKRLQTVLPRRKALADTTRLKLLDIS